MVIKKTKRAITADDVPCVFDPACIARLADIGRLPDCADRQRFADGIREAASIYAKDARKPSTNEVDVEIERLYRAALQHEYKQIALLIDALSPEARRLSPEAHRRFEAREATPGFQIAGLKFPSAEALRDPARRDRACEVVQRFCSMGIGPRGKPLLYVSSGRITRPPRREAERRFVMNLRVVWLVATGETASATVNPARPGPFARFVHECLKLALDMDAPHADAVGLINDLHEHWREMQRLTGREIAAKYRALLSRINRD
jgi:hypothetical protein